MPACPSRSRTARLRTYQYVSFLRFLRERGKKGSSPGLDPSEGSLPSPGAQPSSSAALGAAGRACGPGAGEEGAAQLVLVVLTRTSARRHLHERGPGLRAGEWF